MKILNAPAEAAHVRARVFCHLSYHYPFHLMLFPYGWFYLFALPCAPEEML